MWRGVCLRVWGDAVVGDGRWMVEVGEADIRSMLALARSRLALPASLSAHPRLSRAPLASSPRVPRVFAFSRSRSRSYSRTRTPSRACAPPHSVRVSFVCTMFSCGRCTVRLVVPALIAATFPVYVHRALSRPWVLITVCSFVSRSHLCFMSCLCLPSFRVTSRSGPLCPACAPWSPDRVSLDASCSPGPCFHAPTFSRKYSIA